MSIKAIVSQCNFKFISLSMRKVIYLYIFFKDYLHFSSVTVFYMFCTFFYCVVSLSQPFLYLGVFCFVPFLTLEIVVALWLKLWSFFSLPFAFWLYYGDFLYVCFCHLKVLYNWIFLFFLLLLDFEFQLGMFFSRPGYKGIYSHFHLLLM